MKKLIAISMLAFIASLFLIAATPPASQIGNMTIDGDLGVGDDDTNNGSATYRTVLIGDSAGAQLVMRGLGPKIVYDITGGNDAEVYFDTEDYIIYAGTPGAPNERMRIEQAGDVGIGITNPTDHLHVYGTGNERVTVESTILANDQESEFKAIGLRSGGATAYGLFGLYYHSGITEATGYIGLSENDEDLDFLWFSDAGNLMTSQTKTHIGTASGTVVGTQSSDIRLKQDIKTIPYGLDAILALEPIEFKYKSGGTERLGFSAQQVQPILPQVVYDTKDFLPDENGEEIEIQKEEKDKDGKITQKRIVKKGEMNKLAMRYAEIVPVLVKAMQEQQAQIDALAKRIEKLEK